MEKLISPQYAWFFTLVVALILRGLSLELRQSTLQVARAELGEGGDVAFSDRRGVAVVFAVALVLPTRLGIGGIRTLALNSTQLKSLNWLMPITYLQAMRSLHELFYGRDC